MALIKCPECQKEVSDSALYCPACGKQIKKLKRSFFGKLIKWIFILFNIFMIYTLLVGLGGTSEIIIMLHPMPKKPVQLLVQA